MRKLMVLALLAFVSTYVTACATQPAQKEETALPKLIVEEKPAAHAAIIIDYVGLQNSLGLTRARERLGYLEKPFDTCRAGHGYPSAGRCGRDYFMLIHFQLLCRDAEESSHSAFDSSRMSALSGRVVSWSIKGQSGTFSLDEDGFGQIRTTSPTSHKYQRLKIVADNEALYIKAGEIGRVVAPPSWCSN